MFYELNADYLFGRKGTNLYDTRSLGERLFSTKSKVAFIVEPTLESFNSFCENGSFHHSLRSGTKKRATLLLRESPLRVKSYPTRHYGW